MTIQEILNGILEREGEEYTNDPVDRGGPTKWGVTLPVLSEFRGSPVTIEQLKALTRDEAYEVFEHLYARRSHLLNLADERVAAFMVDWAVNSGVETAIMQLQKVLGVKVDGICGPITLGAANRRDNHQLLKDLGRARQKFLVGIVKQWPHQIRFLQGWLDRNWTTSVDPL